LSRKNKAERESAGFTLIEVLVSLAIIGFVIASLSALIGTTVRGNRSIETHLRRLEAAREIFTALPGRDQLVPGSYWGKLASSEWRIDITPFASPDRVENTQSTWVPEKVAVSVQQAGQPAMRIETVRLRRRQ
jgi:general secretion pathway protein I